jgi:hypothetical protein
LIAVCALKRSTEGPTRLESISKGEALRLLAPSSVLQIPGHFRQTLETTTRILHYVSAFRLHISNLEDVPSVIGEMLGGPWVTQPDVGS